ncbi:hypothetical protein F5B18DRAFT_639305 [Nemania serpens]|nr:hypothetical protein F5B18DRAFT_639305 [Nemania serpens]
MKFQTILSAVTLIVGVIALPATSAYEGPSNRPVSVQNLPDTPEVYDGAQPFLTLVTKRGVESAPKEVRVIDLSRRTTHASLVIDIWQDSNRGGRHEGLYSDTQVCYELYNGWNDQISSLYVPSGFGCQFYQDGGCSGSYLQVPGNYYLPDLLGWSFNDLISSYRCYN